jgi:hypothetical protein
MTTKAEQQAPPGEPIPAGRFSTQKLEADVVIQLLGTFVFPWSWR